MALRARRSALQVQLEVTEGTDPGSWTSAHVLPLTALSESLNPDTQQLNEYGGSLDAGETIVGAFKPTVTARGALRGSGVPATPMGPLSALMQAAGFVETLRSATLPAAAVQPIASGTANTVTFDGTTGTGTQWPTTTAAGTAGAAKVIGEVVEIAGDPTTATTATIIDYSASGSNRTITLNRTATQCGAAGASFTSSTTIRRQIGTKWELGTPSPHPSVTARQFRDGLMQLFTGCRPNARFTLTTGSFAEFEFGIGGQFVSRTDVAVPTAPTVVSPTTGVNGYCTFTGGSLVGVELGIQQLTFDVGNSGQYPDDLNQLTGIQPYLIGSRKGSGSVNPLAVTAAVRNLITLIQAGTKGALVAHWGPKTSYSAFVGNRHSFLWPNAKYLDSSITEDNVVLRETLPFEPTSFDGGCIIYHY